MAVDADLVYGFSTSVLAPNFDEPKPTPGFHKEMWEMCCSDRKRVALAAPRGHGKSSAISFAYLITVLLFQERQFAVIVSDTEGQASMFLNMIKNEVMENSDIIELFGIYKIKKDSETDLIVQFHDFNEFRVLAKGAEQKMRGFLWRGKRPDIIIVDDLENDELVLNKDRRKKLRNWFYGALLPTLSDSGIIRCVGTILHLDSLLERLLQDDTWLSRRFRAHNNDFSEILWPEKFDKETLEEIRRGYINQGFPEGYSQEYLNYPIDIENALFRKQDFVPMAEEELNKRMVYYAAADFAIGEKEDSDYTVMLVGGMDDEGYLNIVDMRKGRFPADEIINEMMNIQKRYEPQVFIVETEKIDKALGPFLKREMLESGVFINIERKTPTKDKIQRAASIAGRMRQGGVKFNKEADWFPELEDALMKVTRSGVRGTHEDELDAFAWLGLGIDEFYNAPTEEEFEEEEYQLALEESGLVFDGRNATTGY